MNKLNAASTLAGDLMPVAIIMINPVSGELFLKYSPDLKAKVAAEPAFLEALQQAVSAALAGIARDTLEG